MAFGGIFKEVEGSKADLMPFFGSPPPVGRVAKSDVYSLF
jgi:hypothetical protein